MNEEIDLIDIVKFFWSKKTLLIVCWIIALFFSIIYTYFFITPKYNASTSLILIKTEFKEEAEVTAYSKLVDRYCVIAKSKAVAFKVIENLKLNIDVEKLQENILIEGNSSSYSIAITVENENSELAVKIADEIAKVFIDKIKTEFNDEEIRILDYATTNNKPININLLHNIFKFIIILSVLLFGYLFIYYIIKVTSKK